MTASPACWKRYEKLLAVQYSDPARMAFHQIVVDAYAVQHPDGDEPRAIRSVGIHLMTLCIPGARSRPGARDQTATRDGRPAGLSPVVAAVRSR